MASRISAQCDLHLVSQSLSSQQTSIKRIRTSFHLHRPFKTQNWASAVGYHRLSDLSTVQSIPMNNAQRTSCSRGGFVNGWLSKSELKQENWSLDANRRMILVERGKSRRTTLTYNRQLNRSISITKSREVENLINAINWRSMRESLSPNIARSSLIPSSNFKEPMNVVTASISAKIAT